MFYIVKGENLKSFFNKIIDVFSFVFSKLSILIILLVLGLLIYTRLNSLFKLDLIGEGSLLRNTMNQINQEEVVETRQGPAKIVYHGNVPTEEEVVETTEDEGEIISFEIIEEQSPQQVAQMLKSVGLISDPPSLVLLLEESGLQNSIVPGSYEVNSTILNRELIAEITNTEAEVSSESTTTPSGETAINLVSFEIVEGQTPEEVANVLKDAGLISDPPSFILLLDNANLRDEIKPGVYRVPSDIKNLDLIETITIATR